MSIKAFTSIFTVFFLLPSFCHAITPAPGPYDVLRSKSGTIIIKCSPDGKAEGSVLPGDAIKMLKKGSVLHVMPGSYSSNFEISVDGIIIEGEPGKYSDAGFNIKGKKTLIRNLWTSSVDCNADISIIDSVIGYYSCESGDKKFDQEFYNCCFNSLSVYGYKDNKLSFRNCSIVSDNSQAIYFSWGEGNVSFTNCILYGKNSVFRFPEQDRSTNEGIRLYLENALLFGEMAMADGVSKGGVNNSGKDEKAIDIKGLKRLAKQVIMKGEVITERPIFKKELNPRAADVQPGMRGAIGSSYYSCRDLKVFILEDKSPGKDKNFGANLDESGFPVPEQPKDKKKTDAPPPPPPPAPKPEPAPEKAAPKKPADEKPASGRKSEDINLDEPGISAPANPRAQ